MKEKSPYSSSKPGIRAKKNSPVTRKGNKKKSSGVRITNNELTEVIRRFCAFEFPLLACIDVHVRMDVIVYICICKSKYFVKA